jgi:hypothetical protein
MATREELKNALVDAHKAGDFEAAETFAGMIRGNEFDPETTVLGATGEMLKGIPRGVANSLISTGEGLFQLADAGLNLVGLEDAIDEEDEDYLLNLARQGREALNESALGVDQRYQDSFGTKFGEGLGSFFTFLGPGLIGKAAGLTGKGLKAAELGGAGTLAYSAGAGDQSQRIAQARAQGIEISPETEDAAIFIGAAIGLTELAPVERLFRGLPADVAGQSLAKSIMPRLINAAKTGGVEGVQEVTAGLLQDFTARGLYDPNTPIGESAWDDLTVGGAVGAAADLVVNYAAGRRKSALNQAALEEERRLREKEAADEQARREARSAPAVEEEVDVINVEPATVPFTTTGKDGAPIVEQRLAGGNPYKATAIAISGRMGSSFPMYESFALEQVGAESTIVVDSQGKQYGPEYADPREAIQLAGALNEQVLEQSLEQNNLLAISEMDARLDDDQKRSLLTLGRQVLGADRTTYNKSAVDYAAGTIAEEGFADDLTAQQAMEAGVKPKDMTASQRLNAARIKKGLPETDRFSISEVRRALGDNVGRLAEFESGASEVDTLRAMQKDGVPMISIDRDGVSTGTINSRPATAQEKDAARSAGKRAPNRVKFTSMRDAMNYAAFVNQRKGGSFISSSELFGEEDLSREKFEQLLAAKNIDMGYMSPEMRQIAQRYTGRKLRRDQSINDLTKEERQLLYYKLRQAPRFNKPTQVPLFEVKPYSPAQLQLAVDHLREQGSDIPRAAFEFRGVEIKPAAYEKVVKKAREIASPAPSVAVEESEILALPAPDQRRQAMAKAISDRLTAMGLAGDITAKLVDRVRLARVDAEGNITFVEDPRSERSRGAYNPAGRVMQVSIDTIMEEVGPDATDAELEAAILGTFNHETIHALRALDLITQEELELLERVARRYKPVNARGYEAGETFVKYAARQYSNLNPVQQMEEAIAELIKYGYQNKLIDDRGNPVKLGGKPRTLMRRIMDFFKQMVGFTRGVEARNFSDFLRRLETGEVGARERGEIRTLYQTERQAGVVPERAITGTAVVADTSQRKPQAVGDQPTLVAEEELAEGELLDRVPLDTSVDIIEVVSGAEQPPKLKGKKAVAGYLQRRTLERLGGVPRNINREADREAIADDLAREAIFEYENQESAVEWYNETIDKTIEMLAEVHPEIKTDPGSRAAFLMSLAITSQNLAVPDNLALAEQAYNYYKKNGKFKEEGKGDKKKSMEANFKKANKLLAKMTPVEIEQFLRTEFLVKDLNKASKALLGKQADTGELAANTVYGSAIFGPKIGNGFYTNLRGDFSPVTMDMWFMRTMGRLAGTLTGTSKTKLDNAYKRFATAVGKKRVVKDAIERQAREAKSQHESDYRKYAAEFKSGKREKSEKTLAAENLIKLLDGTNDVPMNGTHRNQLRDITYRAIQKFEEATGVSIEPAAFQALIWYPEQDLYKSLGVNLRHVRQDYATSTEQYLTKLGVDRGRIKRAKDRVRRRAERGPDGVRRDADVGGRDRRGAGRLDSALSETEQLEDRSARQIDPVKVEKAVQQNLDAINQTQGPPRFSVKASPEAQYIGRNPEAALVPDEQLYDQPEYSPAAQSAIDKLTTGPEQEQANGKVYMQVTGSGPIGTMLTTFKQLALNRYAGLEKYYQKVPMLRELEADSSAIAAALFADRSRGILASAIKQGVPVYENGLTKVVDFYYGDKKYNGLIDVMSLIYNKEVGDLRKLAQAYAIVKRADYLKTVEYKKKVAGKVKTMVGKETPVDEKTRAEILAAVDALTDVNGYNPVTEWHDVWQAYNNKTIDFLKATGILNDETADQWQKSAYVPFYRQAQGDKNVPKVATGVFGDLTHLSSFKEYKGSEKAVDIGLIESISLNLSAAIEMGMRNVAQQRIARDMQALGLARQVGLKQSVPNGVKFKVNGNPVQFEIDDNLIYSSMETLGGGVVTDILTKTLGFPSMVLRETITRDPGFMIANLMRDTFSTFVTSGSNFIPVIDSLRGLGDGMERLERVGVVGGYDYSRDPDDVVKFFADESNRRGIGPDGKRGGPLGMFTTLWRWAGEATTASDAATRNAVYNDVLARTGNEAEAAFQAMEIINFSRRGAHPLARVITAAIPFLNARFQGLDVFARAASGNYSAVRNPRGKTLQKFATRALLLSGISGIYYMLVSDDDQYKEQSDEVRDNNWLLPTSAGVPVKIPIPFEVGLLFKTVPETIMAATIGEKTAPEVRETITRGIVSTLEINPLGAQAVAPIVEASLNHNFFTGRAIVPYYIDQKITGGLQDSAGTTEMGKYIGQALNISPMKVDHVMFGYTGTIGGYVLNLIDRGMKSEFVQGEDAPLPPSKNVFEFPLWRRFFGQKEGSGLREDAYQLYDEITTVVNTVNRLKKDGRAEDLEAYLASRRHLYDLKDPVYSVKRKLDAVRDQKRKVINSSLDPDLKREMIDDLDAQLNEYLKVVTRLKEAADLPFIETTF